MPIMVVIIKQNKIVTVSPEWEDDLQSSRSLIGDHEQEMYKTLEELGFLNAQMRSGIEIEFYKIFEDEKSIATRKEQIKDGNYDTNDKTDNYVNNENSRHTNLNRAFQASGSDLKRPRNLLRIVKDKGLVGKDDIIKFSVKIAAEPASRDHVAKVEISGINGEVTTKEIALSQSEIVGAPMSSKGAANWLNKVLQKISDSAPEFGINKIDITPLIDNQVANSSGVHHNYSLFAKDSDGNKINLLSDNQNPSKENPAKPSELAVCVAYMRNTIMQNGGLLIHAPTKCSYERYDSFVGPVKYGYGETKQRNNMASLMFRGDYKRSHRVDDPKGQPDGGPARIEERITSPHAFGLADKKNSPFQQVMSYEFMALQTFTMKAGVELYKALLDKRAGKEIDIKSPSVQKVYDILEEKLQDGNSLRQLTTDDITVSKPIPSNKNIVQKQFENSELITEIFGEPHKKRMVERYSALDRIVDQERLKVVQPVQNSMAM